MFLKITHILFCKLLKRPLFLGQKYLFLLFKYYKILHMQVCQLEINIALFCDNFEWVIVLVLKDINNGSKGNQSVLVHEVKWNKHKSITWFYGCGQLCSKDRIWNLHLQSFSLLADFHHLPTLYLPSFSSFLLQLYIIIIWFGSVLYMSKIFIFLSSFL